MAKKDYSSFLDGTTKKSLRSERKNTLSKLLGLILVPLRPLRKTRLGKLFVDTFTNKAILYKILFTVFIIVVYRALTAIPLPGIDMSVYKDYFGNTSASEANYLLLIFTGGQLDSPSIVGLGLAAYINASIVLQLLTPVIPKLTELSKEGQKGTQIINQYTRYLTVVLSIMYSVAYIMLISRRDLTDPSNTGRGQGVFLIPTADGSDWPSLLKIAFMALILTAGTMLVVWLSEAITENGIGNGSSIVISIGIISLLPALLEQDFSLLNFKDMANQLLEGSFNVLSDPTFISLIAVTLGAILVVTSIVFVNESSRDIDIQYASRVRSGDGGQKSSLPIKLTLTGVLPIIFASALLSVPQLLFPFLKSLIDSGSKAYELMLDIESSFLFASADGVTNRNDLYYGALYFVLIVLFGMFYAFIQLKPSETAENLQKQGAFIPGIRPGKSTQEYISNVLLRISFAGSVFLGILALVPLISRNIIEHYNGVSLAVLSGIGGTSILIIVSVILETVRQYNALRVSRSYEKYVK